MLPIPLLIAMVLAFGIDPPQTGVPPADVLARVLETFGGITLVAALAFGLGFWVALAHCALDTRPRGSVAATPWRRGC